MQATDRIKEISPEECGGEIKAWESRQAGMREAQSRMEGMSPEHKIAQVRSAGRATRVEVLTEAKMTQDQIL